MPSATDPIVTTDELTKYLSGDPETYVKAASAVVRAYCNWHIWPEITETVYLVGRGSMVQPLPTLKSVSVADLKVDGKDWEPFRYDLVSHTNHIRARRLYHDLAGYMDYVEDYQDAWRWGYNHFPKGAPVQLSLTHGYKDVPESLKSVVMNIAGRAQALPSSWLRALQTEDYRYEFVSRTSTESVGGFQLTLDDMNQLASFVRPGVA